MRVLFIGDVVGKPGRRALKERLPSLKRKHGADFTIANGENASDGFGIGPKQAEELVSTGVDLITTGPPGRWFFARPTTRRAFPAAGRR